MGPCDARPLKAREAILRDMKFQMHVFPAGPSTVALTGPVVADPLTDPIELPSFLISMWMILAWGGLLIAANRLARAPRGA